MYTSLLYTVISAVLFGLFALLFTAESRRGKRMVLSSVRGHMDSVVVWGYDKITHLHFHFGTGAVRMLFHYSTHKILVLILAAAKYFEVFITQLLRQNRDIAKVVRQEQNKNHLDRIADHKVDVSLTEKEKTHRRETAMAGDE